MRVFQSSYKDKSGKTCKTLTWYVEFTDHRETRRKVSGFRDHKQTEALGRNIERLVSYRVSGEPLDPSLTKWVEGLPAKLRIRLHKIGLLDQTRLAALEPLRNHVGGVLRYVCRECDRKHESSDLHPKCPKCGRDLDGGNQCGWAMERCRHTLCRRSGGIRLQQSCTYCGVYWEQLV